METGMLQELQKIDKKKNLSSETYPVILTRAGFMGALQNLLSINIII